jgi:hypothetical protein
VCTEQHRYTAYGVLAASQVHFLDYGKMNKIFTYSFRANEVAVACSSVRLGGSDHEANNGPANNAMVVDDNSGRSTEYIVIGTALTPKGDLDSRSGRVIVFEVTHQSALSGTSSSSSVSSGPSEGEKVVRLVCEKEFTTAVMSICAIRGKLAAGLGGKVRN